MARADVDVQLSKIDDLISEINSLVPSSSYQAVQFRADLAGLLVVAMAAAYETCVKDILHQSAQAHHVAFGNFAHRHYSKLNSRVRTGDLRAYCDLYDPQLGDRFKAELKERKRQILERVGKNIETSYHQILDWRHDFAHARIRNTTIEEAAETHKVGKRIIYIFDKVMLPPSP